MSAFVAPLSLNVRLWRGCCKRNVVPLVRMLSAGASRPTEDDVERLSRGRAAERRGTGSRAVPHRLNAEERGVYDRAISQGYITLSANLGHRRERKGSPLFNIWRMWNDARRRPTVFFIKRGGSRLPTDEVWVDMSTLFRHPTFPQHLTAAMSDLVRRIDETVAITEGTVENDLGEEIAVQTATEEEQGEGKNCEVETNRSTFEQVTNTNTRIGSFIPTWRIPEVLLKYRFEDRGHAKQTAKNVGALFGASESTGSVKKKVKARRPRRASVLDEGGWDEEESAE